MLPRYPNPEEGEGALALSIATAEAAGSTLILANDPDADRLAVAVQTDGEWRILSGNEIGALFGHWVWLAYAKTGAPAAKACMLSSTVSSMVLKSMAAKVGARYVFPAAQCLDMRGGEGLNHCV